MNTWDIVTMTHDSSRSVKGGLSAPDCSDVHCSLDFLENVESVEDAQRGRYSIQLSLAFDAFPIAKRRKWVLEPET